MLPIGVIKKMALCNNCQAFDIQVFNIGDGFPYRGYPLTELLDSVDGGCSFCNLVLEHLLLSEIERNSGCLSKALRRRREERLQLTEFLSDLPSRLREGVRPTWVHFYVNARTRGGDGEPLKILHLGAYASYLVEENPVFAGQAPTALFHAAADLGTPAHESRDIIGNLHTDTGQEAWPESRFHEIIYWQKTCSRRHHSCKKTLSRCESLDSDNSPLPTRCVKIMASQEPGGMSFSIALCETTGKTGKYIALSHRWTPETELAKTLRGNYADRIGAGGRPVQLTPVFRDACHLAHKLGIGYVWIDSICIVQDDPDDWAREAVRMADYYQRSWLTIAATKTNSQGGLFSKVDRSTLPRIARLPYRDKRGEQNGYFYLQCVDAINVARDYKTWVTNSELLSRGWVYQEWLLSRRILSFADSGPFLSCQSEDPRSVIGDYVLRRDTQMSGDEGRTELEFEHHLDTDNFSTQKGILSQWETVVQSYSGLRLTKLAGDRLVALAGVASEYSKALKAKKEPDGGLSYSYVGGLWFPHTGGLLWEPIISCTVTRLDGLPTWSWASLRILESDGTCRGMQVRWSTNTEKGETRYAHNEDKALLKEQCMLESVRQLPVHRTDEENDAWKVDFDWNAGGAQQSQTYGNDCRFFALQLKGLLWDVNIHGYFETKVDADTAGFLTAHSPDFGREYWRKVTVDGTVSDEVTGWASLEHPEYQVLGSGDTLTTPMLAFVVASIENLETGPAFGNIWRTRSTAYKVLYVRPVSVPGQNNVYERVGVGGLFGEEVDAIFKSSEDPQQIEIWLV